MSTMNVRMPAEERRALILAAATKAFAEGGYAGTSTDAVAKVAGVSQPYVVRMFGTKLELFLEVYTHACDRIAGAFRGVLDERPFDPSSEEDKERMAQAYTDLLADSDFLHVLMHGFSASAVPEIGVASRDGMGRIFATLRDTGWSDEGVRDFIAYGMLLNVLLSIGAFGAVLDGPMGAQLGPLADLVRACAPDLEV
ncbi:MAG: TetR/AcrR family transcriptional regulator [Nocardioides sp.]